MSFRPTLARLAAGIQSIPPNATAQIAAELLPPIALYRRLLRVHRKVLPHELRVMGDDYVKAEFRRTRSTDNPLHIVGFLSEWKKYLDFHEAQVGGRHTLDSTTTTTTTNADGARVDRDGKPLPGMSLDPSILESLSADQIGQLYELFQATKDVYLSDEELKAKLEAEERTEEGIPAGEVLPDLGVKGGSEGSGGSAGTR
ncbi:hypothetical protein JCM10212_000924 [Sporobolomyces blumeae]